MSLPPPPPSSPSSTTETIGGPLRPRRLPPLKLDLRIDRSQLPIAATALGVALVSAAVVLSALYSRHSGDLDGSNYAMGVLATLGLLGGCLGALLLLPRSERQGALVTWPGAAGVAGVGLMLAVAITKNNVSVYTASIAVIILSIGGYLLTRGASFVLTTIAGTVALYVQAFNDLIPTGKHGDDSLGFGFGDNEFMVLGAAIVVFVVLATTAAWFLPETRVLSGIVIGVGGVAAMGYLFEFLSISHYFFEGSGGGYPGSGAAVDVRHPFVNDTYVVLGYCFLLALFWLACSLSTGNVGFRILALAITLLAVPLTTFSLSAKHPTWWEVASCALGGLILVGAAIGTRRTPAGTPRATPAPLP
jgi:hypothetical protein